MSIVAITGAGGYVGQQLITYLEKAPWWKHTATNFSPEIFQKSAIK